MSPELEVEATRLSNDSIVRALGKILSDELGSMRDAMKTETVSALRRSASNLDELLRPIERQGSATLKTINEMRAQLRVGSRDRQGLSGRERFTAHAVLKLCTTASHPIEAVYAERYAKAAVNPATTVLPSWAQALTGRDTAEFLAAPPVPSLLARLGSVGLSVSIPAGEASQRIPFRIPAATPQGSWVDQGQPIRVVAGNIGALPLYRKKVAVISTFTWELRQSSTNSIETVVDNFLRDDLRKLLDATLIDDVAATNTRPAGLRNGVAALPAGANMAADIRALVGAVLAGGASFPVLLANPLQGLSVAFAVSGSLTVPILTSPSVPAGMLICVDGASFASVLSAPEVDTSDQVELHMENVAPKPLVSAAAAPPAVADVATPVRSMFQTASLAMRTLIDADWTLPPGRTAWMENIAW